MTNKTFFTLVAIALIAFAGYFVVQLNAMPATTCIAHFDFECEAYAVLTCGGENYLNWRTSSWCEGDTCWGRFLLWCVDEDFKLIPQSPLYCSNPGGCPGGGGAN